jgi:adenylate cyclase
MDGGAVTSDDPRSRENGEFWRDFLSGGHSREHAARQVLKLIPRAPRCRLCAAPFSGVGAPLMRLFGKRPSDKNPNWCASCFTFMSRNHGGAEIEVTMLFADVRGSTTLAEGMSSADFRGIMDRFYDTGATAVFDHDGIVDKFVGDELVAMFFPLLSGDKHSARAIDAARALLQATGHGEVGGPWIPWARASTRGWPGLGPWARVRTRS